MPISSPTEWKEEYGHIDPYKDDEKPRPSEANPIDYEEDEHGRYNPYAGCQSREAALEAGRCGEVLCSTWERYDEIRYCTRVPLAAFHSGDGEGSPLCYEHCPSAKGG